MTEHKDMTISEIEEVLKEYTCEFVRGKDNYYYSYVDKDFIHTIKTNYDFTQNFYFDSVKKIYEFIGKIGDNNFEKFSKYLNKDLLEPNIFDDAIFSNERKIVRDKINQYSLKETDGEYNIYTIKPFKENGKYTIKYIKIDSYKDIVLGDNCFETLEDAEKCVNEIGEYNILHYYFFIKDSVLKESNTTPQKDTPYIDLAINEISGIVEEYSKEFAVGEENWYVYITPDNYCRNFKTCIDSSKIVYFESEEKIGELKEFLGVDNFVYYFSHLYKDLHLDYTLFASSNYIKNFRYVCDILDNFNLDYYEYKNKDHFNFWYIVPEKVNDYYKISCKMANSFKDLGVIDHYYIFESLGKVRQAIKEIGEYNILHYLFFIKDEFLEKDTKVFEDNLPQKDMVKNPSHYQGKNGLEVYEVLENFLSDVESYYLGNVIKYILRYKNKNGLEDLKKAREYLNKMIERLNDGE